jgi:hypothetical protein
VEERLIRTVILAAAVLGACSQRVAPPSADAAQQPFPDMAGRAVLVLPVQAAAPLLGLPRTADPARPPVTLGAETRAALEAELGYWLSEHAPRVRWVLPDAVERAVLRAPTLDVRVRELAVQDFLRAKLESIGDPLYGELRKVGALFDTRPVLLPIGAVWIPETDGRGRVHLALALIDTTGGAVVWSGVVAGAPAAAPDGAAAASVAQALARLVAGR